MWTILVDSTISSHNCFHFTTDTIEDENNTNNVNITLDEDARVADSLSKRLTRTIMIFPNNVKVATESSKNTMYV